MYSFEEFREEFKAETLKAIPEEERSRIKAEDVSVVKINDQVLNGICLHSEDYDAAPTIYIDDSYDQYKAGESIKSMAERAADTCMPCMPCMHSAPFDIPSVQAMQEFDKIRDAIGIRVVDKERNKLYLADKPYMDIDGGLAAVYTVEINDECSTVIDNGFMRGLDAGIDQVREAALYNAVNVDHPELINLSDLLFGGGENLLDGEKHSADISEGSTYVLKNEKGIFGAKYLAVPEVLDKACDAIGKSCYVLPSSLHEVILVPESSSIDVRALQAMVKDANSTVVSADDILSDDVFCYDAVRHSFSRLDAVVDVEEDVEEDMDV